MGRWKESVCVQPLGLPESPGPCGLSLYLFPSFFFDNLQAARVMLPLYFSSPSGENCPGL